MQSPTLTTQFATIVNLSVDLIGTEPPPISQGNGLYVYWRGDRPVLQRWLINGELALPSSIAETPVQAERVVPAPMSLSLIICTRDRPAALERCLAALKHQSLQPDEVIVIDNASVSDDTRDVALKAGATYFRENQKGLSFARNSGIKIARSEIVVFTDDDTEPHKDWLGELIQGFINPQIVAVTGLVLPARLDTQAQWIFERFWSFSRGFKPVLFDRAHFEKYRPKGFPAWNVGAGANMAFRREIFDILGPFDTRLGVGASGCSEDSEYWYRILSHGYACLYHPAAVMHHYHRDELPALRTQLFSYMRGHATALLVQFERSGDWGNVRRLLISLPLYYLMRIGRAWKGTRDGQEQTIWVEISGLLSGVLYFLKRVGQ